MPRFNAKKLKDDYKPPADRPDFVDGQYNVVGIKWKFLVNDKPILKMMGSKLKGGFNYILEDGTEGPFGTIELHAMNKLQFAFNKEAQFQIPPDESNAGEVAKFMVQLAEKINDANHTRTIEVKDGWSQSYHLQVPADCDYNLRIVDVKQLDDGSYVYSKQWDSGTSYYFKIRLRVESGKFGNPFADNEFNVEVPYGVKNIDGDFAWTVDKEGKRTPDSRITESFFRFTLPGMLDSDFDTDNLVDYWVENVTLPSGVFKTYVKKAGKKETIYYKPVWYKAEWVEDFDVPDVFKTAVEEESSDEPVFERKVLTDDEMNVEARNTFISMLSQLVGESVADEGYELNEVGKQTAKKYLTPLLEKKKIKPMKIRDMPHDHVMDVMNVLFDSLSEESDKNTVAQYLERVQEMLVGGFESPEFNTGGDEW